MNNFTDAADIESKVRAIYKDRERLHEQDDLEYRPEGVILWHLDHFMTEDDLNLDEAVAELMEMSPEEPGGVNVRDDEDGLGPYAYWETGDGVTSCSLDMMLAAIEQEGGPFSQPGWYDDEWVMVMRDRQLGGGDSTNWTSKGSLAYLDEHP